MQDLTPLKDIATLLSITARNIGMCFFPKYLLELPFLLQLNISDNSLQDLPYEIVEDEENCLQHARHWFADLEQGKENNYEVKLILIGNGRVGKSSLLERLVHNKYTPGRKSTHAIQLERWEFPTVIEKEEDQKEEVKLTVNCWDFGGQDIYHATHRLFMQSRALYLVVWDWDTENTPFVKPEETEDETIKLQNHHLPYWVHYVRTLSKRSPVIVIQNKVDRDGYHNLPYLDALQQIYKIEDYFPVSAESDRGIFDLRQAITKAFKTMPELGMEMPIAWYKVREKIKEVAEAEKDIPYERFIELCDEAEVRAISRPSLLRYLHDTGILFYKENLFQNRIILDQQWAINAIYALFDRDSFYYKYLKRGDGKFLVDDLRFLWENYFKRTISDEECLVFISFMESCEICFKINENNNNQKAEYIAPQLLPEDKPSHVSREWNGYDRDALHLIYQNDFLHYAIIQRFLVRAGHLAQERDIWKYGIQFFVNQAAALIEVMKWNEKDVIHVQVKGTGRKELLDKIRKEFKQIYYDEAGVDQFAALDGEHYINLEDWSHNKSKDIQEMLAVNGEKVNVTNFQEFEEKEDGRYDRKEEEPKGLRDLKPTTPATIKPLKFFISYAHEDEVHRVKLEEQLLVLKRTGVIEIWTDREMLASSDVDKEIIFNRLESADVVCMLVSKAFIKSDYCYAAEMTRAVEKHHQNLAKVIPIILDKVPNFNYLPFAKIAALPQDGYDKPLNTWEKPEAAWEHINEGITKLVEELRRTKV